MVLELARALRGVYNYDHSCIPFGLVNSNFLSKPETRTIETMQNFTVASVRCVAVENYVSTHRVEGVLHGPKKPASRLSIR